MLEADTEDEGEPDPVPVRLPRLDGDDEPVSVLVKEEVGLPAALVVNEGVPLKVLDPDALEGPEELLVPDAEPVGPEEPLEVADPDALTVPEAV